MTLKQALKILKHHQKWRKGADTEMTDPKKLTEAIEIAINLLSKLK